MDKRQVYEQITYLKEAHLIAKVGCSFQYIT